MTSEKWFKSSKPGFMKLKLKNRALTLISCKCERNEFLSSKCERTQ